jgi:hypothetical protein
LAASQIPLVATAYDFRDPKGKEVLNLTDSARICALPNVPIPDPAAPKSTDAATVKISVLYGHLNSERKTLWQGLNKTIHPEAPEQDILRQLVATILTSDKVKSWWGPISRNMSLNACDYEWCLRNNMPIICPWQEDDIIRFRDPNPPSTDPQFSSSLKSGGGSGAAPHDSAPPPPPDADGSSGPSDATTNASALHFTTFNPATRGNVDIGLTLDDDEVRCRMSVHCTIFAEDLRRRFKR